MKTKLISNYMEFQCGDTNTFDTQINEFVRDKKVLDIQYQNVLHKSPFSGLPTVYQSALIMYEDSEE